MNELKPLYHYRLRILAEGRRFYRRTALNRYLEKRGLIRQSGRTLPPHGLLEYEITDAGIRMLVASITPSDDPMTPSAEAPSHPHTA